MPTLLEDVIAHQRHRFLDGTNSDVSVCEIDVWVGSPEAWEASGLAALAGWSLGRTPDGLVVAVRLL